MFEKIVVKGDDLSKKHIYAYGIGHVLNDLYSACWFNFFSYYLIQIRKVGETNAGIILLIGQITDALVTPFVGILSDKTNTSIGQRTPWYIGGTILNLIGYTMLWEKCFFCGDDDAKLEFVWYVIFPPIMQMGWAAVQVSHMALLPCISLNRKNKDNMSRIRTGFTFISQLIALGLSFLIFFFINDRLLQYRILSYSVQFIGIIFTVIFLYYCREVPLSKNIENYYADMKNNLLGNLKKKEDGSKDRSKNLEELASGECDKSIKNLKQERSKSYDGQDRLSSNYPQDQKKMTIGESNKYINA